MAFTQAFNNNCVYSLGQMIDSGHSHTNIQSCPFDKKGMKSEAAGFFSSRRKGCRCARITCGTDFSVVDLVAKVCGPRPRLYGIWKSHFIPTDGLFVGLISFRPRTHPRDDLGTASVPHREQPQCLSTACQVSFRGPTKALR